MLRERRLGLCKKGIKGINGMDVGLAEDGSIHRHGRFQRDVSKSNPKIEVWLLTGKVTQTI